ncbi:leukocyte surface antigen CD53-like isoform X2 [Cimex lectularius]|nr:leukocyte surface antigen CD53-like isoform X2 [Cimex lectularius]
MTELMDMKREHIKQPPELKTIRGEHFYKSMQYGLRIVNGINTVLSISFLLIGMILVYKREEGFVIIQKDTYQSLSTAMMLNGAAMTLFSLLGFFTLQVTSRKYLLLFHAIVGAVLLGNIVVSILKIPTENDILNQTKEYLYKSLAMYYNDSTYHFVWDNLQYRMHCCGILSYRDWCHNNKDNVSVCDIPTSCAHCNLPCHKSAHQKNNFKFHVDGCLPLINGYIMCAVIFQKTIDFLMLGLIAISSIMSIFVFYEVFNNPPS